MSRKLCIPLAPAKSGRVSRSMNWVIFLAALTILTAFCVRTSYWVVSASLAVGMKPLLALYMSTWVEPLAQKAR